jgi:hypothetical protein
MVSTGHLHGFESLEEQRFLLALDFAGEIRDVLSQPMRIKFTTVGGKTLSHVPDFLVVTPHGRWLIDVRPRRLVKEADLAYFAAAKEVALSAGWRYSVVAGWHPHVMSALEAMAAWSRPMTDQLGLQNQMVGVLRAEGQVSFGKLVAGTRVPAVARAHALHLLWHRRIGLDLASPLRDASLVGLAER